MKRYLAFLLASTWAFGYGTSHLCGPANADVESCESQEYLNNLAAHEIDLQNAKSLVTDLNTYGTPKNLDTNNSCWVGNPTQDHWWTFSYDAVATAQSSRCPTAMAREFRVWTKESCATGETPPNGGGDGRYCRNVDIWGKNFWGGADNESGEDIWAPDGSDYGPFSFSRDAMSSNTGRLTLGLLPCSRWSKPGECDWVYMEDNEDFNFGHSYQSGSDAAASMDMDGQIGYGYVGRLLTSSNSGQPFVITSAYARVNAQNPNGYEQYKWVKFYFDPKKAYISDLPNETTASQNRGTFVRMPSVHYKDNDRMLSKESLIKLELQPAECREDVIYKIAVPKRLYLRGEQAPIRPTNRTVYFMNPQKQIGCREGAIIWPGDHLGYAMCWGDWRHAAAFYENIPQNLFFQAEQERHIIVKVEGKANGPICIPPETKNDRLDIYTLKNTYAPGNINLLRTMDYEKGILVRAAGQDLVLKFDIKASKYQNARLLAINAGGAWPKVYRMYGQNRVIEIPAGDLEGTWMHGDSWNKVVNEFRNNLLDAASKKGDADTKAQIDNMSNDNTRLYYLPGVTGQNQTIFLVFKNLKPSDELRDFKLELFGLQEIDNRFYNYDKLNEITDKIVVDHDPVIVRPDKFNYANDYIITAYSTTEKDIFQNMSSWQSVYGTSGGYSLQNGGFYIDHAELQVYPVDGSPAYRFYDKSDGVDSLLQTARNYTSNDGPTPIFMPVSPANAVRYALIDNTIERFVQEAHNKGRMASNDVRSVCSTRLEFDVAKANTADNHGKIACNTPGYLNMYVWHVNTSGLSVGADRASVDFSKKVPYNLVRTAPDENARTNALLAGHSAFAMRAEFVDQRLWKENTAPDIKPIAAESNAPLTLQYTAKLTDTSGNEVSKPEYKIFMAQPSQSQNATLYMPTQEIKLGGEMNYLTISPEEQNIGFMQTLDHMCEESICQRGFASNEFDTTSKQMLRVQNTAREKHFGLIIDATNPKNGLKMDKYDCPATQCPPSGGVLKYTAPVTDRTYVRYFTAQVLNHGVQPLRYITLQINQVGKKSIHNKASAQLPLTHAVLVFNDVRSNSDDSTFNSDNLAHLQYMDASGQLKFMRQSDCASTSELCVDFGKYKDTFGGNPGYESESALRVKLISQYNNKVDFVQNLAYGSFSGIDGFYPYDAASGAINQNGVRKENEWQIQRVQGKASRYEKDVINCQSQRGFDCEAFTVEYDN